MFGGFSKSQGRCQTNNYDTYEPTISAGDLITFPDESNAFACDFMAIAGNNKVFTGDYEVFAADS